MSERKPMLATLGDLPSGDDWSFEVKWDGVRALTRIERDGRAVRVTIRSRSGGDITARYPELRGLETAVPDAALPVELDGEIIAFDESGRPSFAELQRRMHLNDPSRAASHAADSPVTYAIFDVLEIAGEDVTGLSLEDRRKLLRRLDVSAEHVSIPAVYDDGEALLAQMAERGMEGVIAKRRASTYAAGKRGRSWLKIKAKPRQEFVIGGWTDGTGNRGSTFGALMLGYHEEGADALTYAGNVGSGFDDRALAELVEAMAPLATDKSPFSGLARKNGNHYVLPHLVADIEYGEMTPDGHLRHPVFKGLRDDKPADQVILERKR